jgi:hypothetical protein
MRAHVIRDERSLLSIIRISVRQWIDQVLFLRPVAYRTFLSVLFHSNTTA